MSSASLPARPLIVLVDDAHAVRLFTARVLTDAGYDVLTAPDGQSAATIIQGLHTSPDLVITDIRMPIMDGDALAGWLVQHYPRIPVLFVTGFSRAEISGPVLHKPFTTELLCAAVRQVLDQVPQD